MSISLVNRSSELCVDMIKARKRMRIDDTMETDELTDLIKTAERVIEHRMTSTLLSSSWVFYCKPFAKCVVLPVARALSLISVQIKLLDGSYQDLPLDDFHLIEYRLGTPANVVELKQGKSLPFIVDSSKSVKIEFTAGYPNKNAIPEDLITAVLVLAKHFDLNREVTAEKVQSIIPMGFESLIVPYCWVSAE